MISCGMTSPCGDRKARLSAGVVVSVGPSTTVVSGSCTGWQTLGSYLPLTGHCGLEDGRQWGRRRCLCRCRCRVVSRSGFFWRDGGGRPLDYHRSWALRPWCWKGSRSRFSRLLPVSGLHGGSHCLLHLEGSLYLRLHCGINNHFRLLGGFPLVICVGLWVGSGFPLPGDAAQGGCCQEYAQDDDEDSHPG